MLQSRISCCMRRPALQRRVKAPLQTRSFYPAKAQFVAINEEGTPTSSETEIRIGDEHQAFIYINPSLGDKIKYAVMQQTGVGNTQNLKKLPMVFYHESRHFAHGLLSFIVMLPLLPSLADAF